WLYIGCTKNISYIFRICPDPDINFFLYTPDHETMPMQVSVGSKWTNLTETDFKPHNPTKIIIHGYNSDMDLPALVEIRKEYLKTTKYNIFTVDWAPLAKSPCYLGAVHNARHVGSCTAQLIRQIRNAGAKEIHLIGFSLGAHIPNYIAISLRPYILPRITGLDPALPLFVTLNIDEKLDKSDAKFVDVYHTNAFAQGKAENSGHVDFFLNGGVVQPGCWAENRFFSCNHHRAPLYFAESINTKKGFWGWPCTSFILYLLGRCPPTETQILMGENVSWKSSGMYLVLTESVSPFAVGKYVGPLVEILKKISEKDRKELLNKYQKKIIEFIEDDELTQESSKHIQIEYLLLSEFADNIFSRISNKSLT
ncbi:unnamed protein product, partial [Brassicogethes aeneus]